MRKHLFSDVWLLMLLVASSSPTLAQSIVPVRQPDGRLVFENAPGDSKPASANAADDAAAPQTNDTGLVFWSQREHRWKPVKPATPASMRAARSAAAEVRRIMRSRGFAQASFNPATNPEWITNRAKYSRAAVAPLQQEPVFGSQNVESAIDDSAKRHNVDPNLVRAVIQVESNFNPHAVSPKGALGLMQLMPRTAKSLKVNNAFDPQQNVDAGVRHLKQLLDSFGGDIELSLAAYNAGTTAVQRHRGVPPYAETRDYVKRISDLYAKQGSRPLLGRPGHPIHAMKDSSGHMSYTDSD